MMERDSLTGVKNPTSPVDDNVLAEGFIEANEIALNSDSSPVTELFQEEKQEYLIEDVSPSSEFIKELDVSLDVKDVHHKKLLDEKDSKNIFYRFFKKVQNFFHIPMRKVAQISIIPLESRVFSQFWSFFVNDNKSFYSNIGSLTDLYLRNNRDRSVLFKREFFFTILFIIISSPIISIFSKLEAKNSVFSYWSQFIVSSSVISLLFAIVPIFFFISLWFVNVNHLHTSRNFHILLFVSYTLSFIFSLLSAFNSILYSIFSLYFDF